MGQPSVAQIVLREEVELWYWRVLGLGSLRRGEDLMAGKEAGDAQLLSLACGIEGVRCLPTLSTEGPRTLPFLSTAF